MNHVMDRPAPVTARREAIRDAAPVTMAAALNAALADALASDSRVLVFGEDVGTLGGVFRVTDGLAARFGEDRVFDTPLAESGIIGTAVRKVTELTLAFDHRVCDGGTAGGFLRYIADCAESPVLALGDI